MKVSIVIFEDNHALRHSLKTYLNDEPGYVVVGEFETAQNADTIVKNLRPDVVIMDVNMPKTNGIEGVRLIKESRPETDIIMYTVFEDDKVLFECLCAGANGYLLKNASLSDLGEAIENVRKGGAPMSPPIARKVMSSFHSKTKTPAFHLSTREQEILKLLVKGYSYKMIASEIFLSLSTVQVHIKNIYTKLHVNCGREAVALALKNRIV